MAMTPDRKEHWTVKAFRLSSAGALLLSQVGCLPRGQKNPDASPPPTISSETTPFITPPVSIEPMIAETPVPGETLAPTETISLPVWSAPTLEQMLVEGRGGLLPEDIAIYKFEQVIPNGLARIGIEGAKVNNFSDNGLADPNYSWAPLVVNSKGLVIWAYDSVIGQLEWPVKLNLLVDATDHPYYSLHTEGLSYQSIPDSKGSAIVWGGMQNGEYGKYLAILAKDPIILPDGRQVYSAYWDRTSQSWLPTPGLAELMLPPLPSEFLSQIPKDSYTYDANGLHITVAEGRVVDIPTDKIIGKLQGETYVLDLAQQSESGYELGLVFRDGKWRETLLDFPFQTNGENIGNFPTITLEDITSGRLAEAERLASQPFPDGVEPLNNYYYDSNYGDIYPDLDPQTGYEFSLHPEKFPMRFVYFYQAEINNIPIVMVTLQVLNKDNVSIFIHMVESTKYINSDRDWWNGDVQLRRVPGFDMALGGDSYDHCKNGWSEAVKQVACSLNGPKRDELQKAMQRLVAEQKIPEEFERILFVQSSGRWY